MEFDLLRDDAGSSQSFTFSWMPSTVGCDDVCRVCMVNAVGDAVPNVVDFRRFIVPPFDWLPVSSQQLGVCVDADAIVDGNDTDTIVVSSSNDS